MVAPAKALTSQFYIKVNGSNLPDDHLRRVTEVVVEQSLHLPSLCVIRLHDVGDDTNPGRNATLKLTDSGAFTIAASLEVAMGREEEPRTVFKGEITSVDVDINVGHPPLLTVRAYDRAHRLHRGRRITSYQQVSDSDIVSRVASTVGLHAKVDATSVVHDYVLQNNQTNWEFLKDRAARNGYELFVDDRTLYFRKPKRDDEMVSPNPKLGQDLLSLRVARSSSFQAKQVYVRGWDSQQKQAIVGQAQSIEGPLAVSPELGDATPGYQVISPFGDATVYVVNRPVGSQAEADNLAKAVFHELDGSYATAEGIATGNPNLKPGKTIHLDTISDKLNGKYYITSATHSVNADEGYTTTFVATGRRSDSILDLIESKDSASGLLPSVVVGVVTDNTDGDKGQGRIKVKFPWLPDNQQSWWCRLASPMAGKDRGFYFLPEVDDEVLVAFEHGDPNHGYIIGALWNGQDPPPKRNQDVIKAGHVTERLIKTRQGHVISLDDTENEEKITITSKSGHVVTLDDKSGSENIAIVDKTGNNLVKVESTSNKITIQANGNIEVTAQQDVKVTAQGNASVQAMQNVDVKSTSGNISVEAQTGQVAIKADAQSVEVSAQVGELNLKGLTVNVEAETQLSLKGNAMVQIQGAMVKIN